MGITMVLFWKAFILLVLFVLLHTVAVALVLFIALNFYIFLKKLEKKLENRKIEKER